MIEKGADTLKQVAARMSPSRKVLRVKVLEESGPPTVSFEDLIGQSSNIPYKGSYATQTWLNSMNRLQNGNPDFILLLIEFTAHMSQKEETLINEVAVSWPLIYERRQERAHTIIATGLSEMLQQADGNPKDYASILGEETLKNLVINALHRCGLSSDSMLASKMRS